MTASFDENRTSPTRRQVLAAAGLVGMGAMVAGWTSRSASAATPAALTGGPTDGNVQFAAIPGANIDFKVLNFALTLEILEANLYLQALNFASGRPAASPLSAKSNTYRRTIGMGSLSLSSANEGFQYLVQFAYVEAAHRDFLTGAIKAAGGTPVKPNPGGYKFPTALNGGISGVLTQILPLEETGVRAYLGALPYLTDLGLATAAASIYSTEARHSAAIAYELGKDPGPTKMSGDLQVTPNQPAGNTFEYYLKPATVIQRASAYFA